MPLWLEIILYVLLGLLACIAFAISCWVCNKLGEVRGFKKSQWTWGALLFLGVMWVAIMPTERIYNDEAEKPVNKKE